MMAVGEGVAGGSTGFLAHLMGTALDSLEGVGVGAARPPSRVRSK